MKENDRENLLHFPNPAFGAAFERCLLEAEEQFWKQLPKRGVRTHNKPNSRNIIPNATGKKRNILFFVQNLYNIFLCLFNKHRQILKFRVNFCETQDLTFMESKK